MSTPYPQLQGLLGVVEDAGSAKIILPEFQRSFVWANNDIKDLLISVLNGYFVGTFLFLRRGTEFDFKIRYFEGVAEIDQTMPQEPDEKRVEKATLDGQQRLTAMFYALSGPPKIAPKQAAYPYRYFARVHDKIAGQDWEDVIWSVSENDRTKNIEIDIGSGTGRRKYAFKEILDKVGGFTRLLELKEFKHYCYENGIVPFVSLRNDEVFNKWLDDYVQFFIDVRKERYADVTKRKEEIRKALKSWFDFQVPALTLENRNFAEVAEIFERINRTGIVLSTFALATAVFFKQKVNLRDWWMEYHRAGGQVAEFCEDDDEDYPKFILQVMALLQGKEVKRKIIINPKEFKAEKSAWDQAGKLLDQALTRQTNTFSGYGVIRPKLLPYKPIIVGMSALLNSCNNAKDFEKLDSWYWSSVLTERYAGSSETAVKQDFDQVTTWLKEDSKKPTVVVEAENAIEQLPLRDVDRGASNKAIMNMIALQGAKDFFTGQSIELSRLEEHHIFPKKSGLTLPKVNSILNKTLISEETNRSILNRKPSAYVAEMKAKLGSSQDAQEMLSTHLISKKAFEAMEADDYDSFLEAREETIKNRMKQRLQGPDTPADATTKEPATEATEPGVNSSLGGTESSPIWDEARPNRRGSGIVVSHGDKGLDQVLAVASRVKKGLSWNEACHSVACERGTTHNTIMAATTTRLGLSGKAAFETHLRNGTLATLLIAKFPLAKDKIEAILQA